MRLAPFLFLKVSLAFFMHTAVHATDAQDCPDIPKRPEESVFSCAGRPIFEPEKTAPMSNSESVFSDSNLGHSASENSRFFKSFGYTSKTLVTTHPYFFKLSTQPGKANVFKSATHSPITTVREAVQHARWKTLFLLLKKHLSRHTITKTQLEALAVEYPFSPLSKVLSTSKKILALSEKTGLHYKTIVPISLFAETFLQKKIAKGIFVFPKRTYGRFLQYDPESKKLFIHLETHGVKPIGFGKSKEVTKTILYDNEHPEVMARGVTSKNIKKEMYAMRALKGVPCLLQAEALLSYKDRSSKKTYMATVTKIFRPGCLQFFLDSSFSSLTLKEKITIAKDLVTGLSGMHENGFVHRDLGAKNHFININTTTKPRTISAVVADFGRTIPVDEAKHVPVQGNAYYLSPEAFFRSSMKGTDYFASDVFAVGCVLWQVRFGKHPAWSFPRFFKRESWSLRTRYKKHLALMNKTRAPYIEYLRKKLKKKIPLTKKDRFLQLILQMTHPKAEVRGTATQLKREFELLYAEFS